MASATPPAAKSAILRHGVTRARGEGVVLRVQTRYTVVVKSASPATIAIASQTTGGPRRSPGPRIHAASRSARHRGAPGSHATRSHASTAPTRSSVQSRNCSSSASARARRASSVRRLSFMFAARSMHVAPNGVHSARPSACHDAARARIKNPRRKTVVKSRPTSNEVYPRAPPSNRSTAPTSTFIMEKRQ